MAMSGWRSWLRWVLVGLIGVFVLIQFVPVDRSNPAVRTEIDAPEKIAAILRRSCYDCHSYETRWPWYSRIAPVSWWLVDHVEHGRGDLNFSEWPVFDFEAQELAFEDIEEQIVKGEMPLRSYLILHPGARLDEDDREVLLRWARSQP
jgi:hypothetical protein